MDPKIPEPVADLRGLVGNYITAGDPHITTAILEPTMRLRWTQAKLEDEPCVFTDSGTGLKLQQLWACRQTGAIEWRDVPIGND